MNEHTLLYQFQMSEDARVALEHLQFCIEEANPLPPRKQSELRYEIRDLWRLLTMEKSQRGADYLSNPHYFSAYLRYFLPWNLVRLVSMLVELPLELSENSTILDIGSGPLTCVLALYCAKPELRKVPLNFVCIDHSPRSMEIGKVILETLAVKHMKELPPWKIQLRRASFGDSLPAKANLVIAANVFNEFFWKKKGTLTENVADLYRTTEQYCALNGSILIVEPGEPRSGGLLSAMRASALIDGDFILAPCPHSHVCPMPGIFRSGQEHLSQTFRSPRLQKPFAQESSFPRTNNVFLTRVRMPSIRAKYPWCHFSIPASYAPHWLISRSEEAGLAKEKLSFSFLFIKKRRIDQSPAEEQGPLAESKTTHRKRSFACRVVSDLLPLAGGMSGRYACSSQGYTLLVSSKSQDLPKSGALVEISTAEKAKQHLPEFDKKSGAILISY